MSSTAAIAAHAQAIIVICLAYKESSA